MALPLWIPQGRQDAPSKVRDRVLVRIGDVSTRQHARRYFPAVNRSVAPEHVHGATVDRARLNQGLGWRRSTVIWRMSAVTAKC
jgi:hypothetical protein